MSEGKYQGGNRGNNRGRDNRGRDNRGRDNRRDDRRPPREDKKED